MGPTGNIRRVVFASVLTLGMANLPTAVLAVDAGHECDRLASVPSDPNVKTRGVDIAQIDVPKALAACERAVKQDPQNARYKFQLSRAYLVAEKYPEAKLSAHEAVELGYPFANVVLGFLAALDMFEGSDPVEATKRYRAAAEAGLPLAAFAYALRLADGLGTDADIPTALKWLERAVEAEYPPSLISKGNLLETGKLYERNHGEALRLFRRASELGNLNGTNRYGRLLRDTKSELKNLILAEDVLRQCAAQGFKPCSLSLGELLSWKGVNTDQIREAETHLRIAFEADIRGAALQLAILLDDEESFSVSEEDVFKLYQKAAEEGFYHAQAEYGKRLLHGQGTAKNVEKGLAAIRQAADAGYTEAQTALYWIFEKGLEVPRDPDAAALWLKKAAESGDKYALFTLALRKIKHGPEQSIVDQGVAEITDLAEKGYSKAQWYLGSHYEKEGPDQDLVTAFRWYQRAAEQGETLSTLSLGEMLVDGRGTEKNVDLGLRLMTKAAKQGAPYDQNQLGSKLIELGKIEEGEFWLRESAKQGYRYGQSELGRHLIEKKASPAEVDEGIELLKLVANSGDAYAMWSLAHYYDNGIGVDRDPKKAIRWYEKSASLGDGSSAGRLGHMYFEGVGVDKDHTKAIEWFRKAAGQGYHFAYVMLGFAYQQGLGVERDFDKAKGFYQKGVDVKEPMAMAAYASLAATGQIEDVNYRTAQALVDKTIEILETAGPETDGQKASVYEQVGNFKTIRGQYSEAEKYYLRALEILERTSGTTSSECVSSLGGYANLLEQSGRFGRAEEVFKRALELAEQLDGETSQLIYTLNYNLALLREAQGRLDDAADIYSGLLTKLKFAFGVDTKVLEGVVNSSLARVHLELGNLDRSDAYFSEAFEALKASPFEMHPEYLRLTADYARLQNLRGNHKDAIRVFETAYERARAIGILDHPLVTVAAVSYADSLWKSGQSVESTDVLETVHEIYVSRISRQSRESLSDLSTERRAIELALEKQVGLLISQQVVSETGVENPRSDLAFRTIQLLHRASAGDAVGQMAVRLASGSDKLAQIIRNRQDLLDEWRDINKSISAMMAQPASSSVALNPRALISELKATENKIEELDLRLLAEFPEYYELTSAKPLSIKEVQALLSRDEALLTYAFGKKTSFLFVLTANGLLHQQLEISEDDVRKAVARVRKGLDPSNVLRLSDVPRFDVKEAYKLYRMIFAPVEPMLKGIRLLQVAPSGPIQSLPLGVLITDHPVTDFTDFSGYRHQSWLAQKYAISVLPTVGSLRSLRRFARSSKSAKPFIGFGDPALDGQSGSRGSYDFAQLFMRNGLADTKKLRELGRLPDAADELREIARILGANEDSIYLGEQATERAVKSADLSNARVISFATHGLVAGEIEGFSEPGLVLTPPEEPSEIDDGYLSLSEIAELSLNADWVILSACNTAASDGTPGAEGLSGLARAFFYAGSRTLLGNRPVNPTSTA